MTVELPPRWSPLRYHAVQDAYYRSNARFNGVWAGRRSGKTEIGKRRAVRKAVRMTRPEGWVICGAPTHNQAKKIFWADLKAMVPKSFLAGRPMESDLCINLVNGCALQVIGLDQPARAEGRPIDHILISEFANVKSEAWTSNIRPALSTPGRLGSADLESVPEGRNHFWRFCMRAKQLQQESPERWGAFHWKSSDILDPEEIIAARQELDELTYRQEYEAEFLSFSGRAYYDWDTEFHVRPLKYDPSLPLIVCFDFNVDPGIALICQEQEMPDVVSADGRYRYIRSKGSFTAVLAEVYVPQNSNTVIVSDKVVSLFRDHPGEVYIYGDATGGARKTSATEGSDWDLVTQIFKSAWSGRFFLRVPTSNPPERYRLNAVNSRLRSIDGFTHVFVDPQCKHFIEDMEGVILLQGGSGELDKKHDASLTHLSDAFGYYIHYAWPIGGRSILQVDTF